MSARNWCLRCQRNFLSRRKVEDQICPDCVPGDRADWTRAEQLSNAATAEAMKRLYGSHGRYSLDLVILAAKYGYIVAPDQKMALPAPAVDTDHQVLLIRLDAEGYAWLSQAYSEPSGVGHSTGGAPYWPARTAGELFDYALREDAGVTRIVAVDRSPRNDRSEQ